MTRTVAALVLSAALTAPLSAQTVIVNTDIGFIGHEGNETTVGSKVDDPAKVRLTVPMTTHGGGGGVISFNYSRTWGQVQFGGNQVEMAMLRVEQAESVRGQVGNPKAEFNFLCNTGGQSDAAMAKCLSFTYDGITAISPGIANSLRGIVGGSGGSSSRMTSPNGQFWLQLQDDGNYVIYDVHDAANPTPTPVFDLWWLLATLSGMGHAYPH